MPRRLFVERSFEREYVRHALFEHHTLRVPRIELEGLVLLRARFHRGLRPQLGKRQRGRVVENGVASRESAQPGVEASKAREHACDMLLGLGVRTNVRQQHEQRPVCRAAGQARRGARAHCRTAALLVPVLGFGALRHDALREAMMA